MPSRVSRNLIARTISCHAHRWIGALFYALLISNITSIISSMSMASRHFEEKVQRVQDYMRAKNLPSDLRDRVREYYNLRYKQGKMFDEAQILSELTPSLREEVKAFEARDLLHKVPLLMASPKEIGAKICAHVRICITFPDECLIHEGHHGESLYFIHSGLVEIKSRYSQRLYHTIGDGCYFGDVAVRISAQGSSGAALRPLPSPLPHQLPLLQVLCGTRRTATCRARTQCFLYELSGERLREVLGGYSEVYDYMHLIAQRRKKRIDALNPNADIDAEDAILDAVFDEEDLRTDLFQETAKVTEKVVGQTQARGRLSARLSTFVPTIHKSECRFT